MLCFSRRRSQFIRIGDDITVMVVEIRPGKVKIGIDAPRDIEVHREEVYLERNRPPVAEAARDVEGT